MSITKEKAIAIVSSSVKDYDLLLANNKYLLICRNNKKNTVDCVEVRFPRYAFQHLTGLVVSKESNVKSAMIFYDACFYDRLAPSDIENPDSYFTELKLKVLPQLINFIKFSKMTVVFNNGRPLLKCDKVVGTTNFSLALTKRQSFYIPVSCLNEDVRKFGDDIYQVLAIFCESLDTKVYKHIKSVAKGVNLKNVVIPDKYKEMIDLTEYREPARKN